MAFKYLLPVVLALIFIATTQATTELVVRLGVQQASDNLKIDFTVTNPTDYAVSVLTWLTPFEGDFYGPIFQVFDQNGNEVAYIGKIARRVWPPTKDSYITLAAHETRTVSVDLVEHYDIIAPGSYIVQFVPPQIMQSITFAEANPVIARVVEFVSASRIRIPESTNCKATEQTQVDAAVKGAITESRAAYSCMNANSCSTLSVRWFGTYNAANYNYDKDVFNKVAARLSGYTFNAYCNPAGCASNVYAYVYPSDSAYTVYLCGAFWSQANERVNTIVHEMSHFTPLGGTQDYAYGKTNCLNLARSNPARASHNADNVCYFSEEAPKL